MKTTARRKPLEEVQEIARKLTREALAGYSMEGIDTSKLELGVLFDGDDRIFEVCLVGERPQDARVLAQVRLNSITGEGKAEVFLDPSST